MEVALVTAAEGFRAARDRDSESLVRLRRSKGWTNVVEWNFAIELIQAVRLDTRIATGDSCHEPWPWPNVPLPLPKAVRGPRDLISSSSLVLVDHCAAAVGCLYFLPPGASCASAFRGHEMTARG